MRWSYLSVIGILFSTSVHAQSYPVSGAWAATDKTMPGTEVKACAAFAKFGLQKLSGNSVGEIVFFTGGKRYDFGGYADTEATNLSVSKLPDGMFKIIDRLYDDGEGGGRSGFKRKTYLLRIVDPNTLEMREGSATGRYVRCASKDVTADRPVGSSQSGLPQKVGECVTTAITSITDRFANKLSPSPSKDGFDPGTAIKFANGGGQVSYEKETAILRSQIGDQVRMCLTEVPKDCPPGDDRGRVYNTKNMRTGEAWTLSDSQHSCGGA